MKKQELSLVLHEIETFASLTNGKIPCLKSFQRVMIETIMIWLGLKKNKTFTYRKRYTLQTYSLINFLLLFFIVFVSIYPPKPLFFCPWQSPHCCPCTRVCFPFCSNRLPTNHPTIAVNHSSLSMTLSLFCLVQFVH